MSSEAPVGVFDSRGSVSRVEDSGNSDCAGQIDRWRGVVRGRPDRFRRGHYAGRP